MQPAVTEALTTLADSGPRWSVIALTLAAAWLLSSLASRVGAAPALRGAQRGLHGLGVLAWVLAAWLICLRLLAAPSLAEMLARAVLLTLLVGAALPVLRDLLAGLALTLEARVRIGDDVRIDGHDGRLVGFGLRSVVLRDRDGTETTLPHRRIVGGHVVRLNLGSRDAPCQFDIEIPADADLELCSRRLLEAALLSPYAAPGRRPEVFTIADAHGGVRVRVRAFVFDRAHEQRYHGDLLARAELVRARPHGA